MASLTVDLAAPNGVQIVLPTGLFINNEFVKSVKGNRLVSIDPASEREIASVEAASVEDIDKAVTAARKAFEDPSWRELSGTERGVLLYKLADLFQAHQEDLATLESWDGGKPYRSAFYGDIKECIITLRYYAGWADKQYGQTIDTTPNKFAYTLRQPLGVCAQIIPWNYPLAMAIWKLGPAIACGNTVVLKPAEQTPLSILFAAKLVREAGFPPGVINVVNGYGPEAGHALASHLGVDKVAFTGSTTTGKAVMRAASANLKNITLETGGKSPLIVFADADLDQAVKWGRVGVMSNMGQMCTATSRILVQSQIYEHFIEKFQNLVRSETRVGEPFAEETTHGPQVSKAQYEQVLRYIDIGRSEGATIALGGSSGKENAKTKGYYVEPIVFTGVSDNMRIYREEIFGPVVVITKFNTDADAVRMANDTTYGLGAAVFTSDIGRGHRMAAKIEAGMVWINSSNDSDFRVPFGGVKQSGIGRELGEAGLAAYSQEKAVHVNLGSVL